MLSSFGVKTFLFLLESCQQNWLLKCKIIIKINHFTVYKTNISLKKSTVYSLKISNSLINKEKLNFIHACKIPSKKCKRACKVYAN